MFYQYQNYQRLFVHKWKTRLRLDQEELKFVNVEAIKD